ncbi:MAG TPA: hypothetical protein VGR62_01610 [Candidatus Binatia bacterium]|jgi:hypothetical protein|nr:hypothetical protein [Candidatus Binatia bacterium]
MWMPLLLVATVARAGGMPADCSTGAIPDAPATLFLDAATTPLPVTDVVEAGSISSGEGTPKWISYRLTLHDKADIFAPVEIDVTVLVAEGAALDGRTFRMPPQGSGEPPSVEPGTPEVQGWSVEDKRGSIDLNHVQVNGSLRLELGTRTGNTLPGRIRLCVPGAQKQRVGKDVVKEAVEVVGSFTAIVK